MFDQEVDNITWHEMGVNNSCELIFMLLYVHVTNNWGVLKYLPSNTML